MKKPIAILLALALVLLAALSFAGCRHNDVDPEINIPSPEPTSEPTWLEPEVIEAFVGDWYGTYKVSEARGIYAQNDKVVNDCAMRVAVDNFGRGGCYLQLPDRRVTPVATPSAQPRSPGRSFCSTA